MLFSLPVKRSRSVPFHLFTFLFRAFLSEGGRVKSHRRMQSRGTGQWWKGNLPVKGYTGEIAFSKLGASFHPDIIQHSFDCNDQWLTVHYIYSWECHNLRLSLNSLIWLKCVLLHMCLLAYFIKNKSCQGNIVCGCFQSLQFCGKFY